MDGDIIQKNNGHEITYKDTDFLFEQYQVLLNSHKENVIKYLDYNYSYNTFDNGVAISSIHRRFYRELLFIKKEYTENKNISNNFLFKKLQKKHLLTIQQNALC